MTNKRLLQINVSANAGSTGKIAEQIGIAAMQSGFESYLAYGKRANPSKSELIRIGSKYDLYNHGIQSRLFDKHGLASKKATRDFLKRVDEIKPTIIHLHNIHDYYLNYPLLFEYLRERKIPIIWTLHDCWPFTGHCAHFDFLRCEKWKNHCEKCPGLRTYPKALLFDRTFKNYEAKKQAFTSVEENLVLVPVSYWIEGFVRESFLGKAKTRTIHNGIDIDIFKPETEVSKIRNKYEIRQEKKIVLGVAAPWSERKGLNDFYRLREILGEEYLIFLVGLSDEQIKGLPEGVVGINRTENQKELAGLYSLADVFANPTYEDNYPTTNIEALACGCPIVVYNTGGAPEAVTQETGFVVEQGNIGAFAEAIKKLTDRGKDVRGKCREWALENCDSNIINQQYIELYNSLL